MNKEDRVRKNIKNKSKEYKAREKRGKNEKEEESVRQAKNKT